MNTFSKHGLPVLQGPDTAEIKQPLISTTGVHVAQLATSQMLIKLCLENMSPVGNLESFRC